MGAEKRDGGTRRWVAVALAGSLAVGLGAWPAGARASPGDPPSTPEAPAARRTQERRTQQRVARLDHASARRPRPGIYYRRNWGIDLVGVHPVASGYMLRLEYRVLDPGKARPFADRASKAYLVDERTRTALAVPAMENVGELRQVPGDDPHRTYFMIFGNPGRLVKKGSRVTLMVGNFRAEGLVVE